MAAITNTTPPKIGTSWTNPDTNDGPIFELPTSSNAYVSDKLTEQFELSAQELKAWRRIDEIKIEKKANDSWYIEQSELLEAQWEAEENDTKREILYRKMQEVMDRCLKIGKDLDSEEAAIRATIDKSGRGKA